MDAQFVGRKVKIELQDGSVYDGFVHSYNTGIGKLSLEKVVCHENGERKKLIGLQHFFADEIDDIVAEEEVLRNKSKGQVAELNANIRQGSGIMRGKCSPVHLKRLNFLEPAKLVLKNQKQNDGMTSSGNDTGGSDSENENPSYPGCTILTKINPLFHEAITYIKSYQIIGLAMEGVSIGREGRLCWIQIAVQDHIFLFDMLGLGPDSFDEGIASIIEDGDILKVLHNCRMVADMLHHQFGVNLINVFDTQVANVFVYRLWHHNDWPRYVDGLAACLVQHLDLSMEEVNWAVVREKYRESDEEVWLERPVRKKLIEALAKNVKHLLSLRQVLMEKMMAEYVAGVNIYLSHVKDASKSDARKYQKEPYLLPLAFQDIKHFMISYSGRTKYSNRNIIKDQFGFRENCSGIKQPHVNFSRDSLWHAGSNITTAKKDVPAGTVDNGLGKYANSIADIITMNEAKRQNDILAKPVVGPQTGTSSGSVDKIDFTENNSNQSSLSKQLSIVDTVQLNGIQDESQSSGQEGLKGTSLMRALVQEQGPEGGEDHSDIGLSQLTPAGKFLGVKYAAGKTKTKPSANSMDIDLSKYTPAVTGMMKKSLTKQERKMMAHMNKKHEGDELWDEEDSIIGNTHNEKLSSVNNNDKNDNRDMANIVRKGTFSHDLGNIQQSLQNNVLPQRQAFNSGARLDTSFTSTHTSPQSDQNPSVNYNVGVAKSTTQKKSSSRLENILAIMNNLPGKNGDMT